MQKWTRILIPSSIRSWPHAILVKLTSCHVLTVQDDRSTSDSAYQEKNDKKPVAIQLIIRKPPPWASQAPGSAKAWNKWYQPSSWNCKKVQWQKMHQMFGYITATPASRNIQVSIQTHLGLHQSHGNATTTQAPQGKVITKSHNKMSSDGNHNCYGSTGYKVALNISCSCRLLVCPLLGK